MAEKNDVTEKPLPTEECKEILNIKKTIPTREELDEMLGSSLPYFLDTHEYEPNISYATMHRFLDYERLAEEAKKFKKDGIVEITIDEYLERYAKQE